MSNKYIYKKKLYYQEKSKGHLFEGTPKYWSLAPYFVYTLFLYSNFLNLIIITWNIICGNLFL